MRKNIRLKYYDYAETGLYFVTICSYEKKKIFCEISDNIYEAKFDESNFEQYIYYTKIGSIVKENIIKLSHIYENVSVDSFVIMPNHIHMIISINTNNNIKLERIIGGFKRQVSIDVKNSYNIKKHMTIWQKSYYDHVIRNEKDYNAIYEYIVYNPMKWKLDEYYL